MAWLGAVQARLSMGYVIDVLMYGKVMSNV